MQIKKPNNYLVDLMIDALKTIIPSNRIRSRYIDVISFASDAGFYQLIPKAVVQPINEKEIAGLFQFCREQNIPLVFRTGGTSLSGQSITDGILVDLSQHWNRIKIESNGDLVRTQPGITGAMVNAYLKTYQRKIGPDPSSISAAMMGGILSNNASGMCCGVKLNSYHTVKHIRFILPNGKAFTTENREDYGRFENECPELFETLTTIRLQIAANPVLFAKIRAKYLTKTTVGYSLNAFVDHEHPFDIFAHLLIGGEGTLAFISEAVMHTVPDYPFKSTALLYFPTIYDACQAIVPLTNAGALMVELMDRASLHAVENMPGIPLLVKTLPETAAALLIEFQESTLEALEGRVTHFTESLGMLSLINEPVFTRDPKEQDFLWKVRKGLFPAVGAVRASGTTVILEDIAFPVERLGDAILDLHKIFKKFEYWNAIIFGHAKDGNIHFVVTQPFDSDAEVTRYELFMKDVVSLVIEKYHGTLKAEHGTGRNMAPFVETEWGGEAYAIMKRIKQSVDPHGLLNPGVIINEDPRAFVKNLKDLPSVEEEVDRCIECGYCEHKCPSRNLTTTPRRRIVIRRALEKLKVSGDTSNHRLLLEQYQYDGLETCAVDGLCAPACPVDINTGDLVKRLRRENHSSFSNAVALWLARNFGLLEKSARLALRIGTGINKVFGKNTMTYITMAGRKLLPASPLWTSQITAVPDLSVLKNHQGQEAQSEGVTIVYLPSCISRMLGSYSGKEKNVMETFFSICEKSGVNVIVSENFSGTCCSQIFSSKGYSDAYRFTANKIINHLWQSTREGKYPVVIDVSSCAHTLHLLRPVLGPQAQVKFDRLKIMDSIDFLHDYVLPAATVIRKKKSIAIHPVCSLQKMKTEEAFVKVAKHFADHVMIPKHTGCCGMAGDRGFMFPELTDSATAKESSEVKEHHYEGYYSSTKTCEMAMSKAVGENYESILYLVDESI